MNEYMVTHGPARAHRPQRGLAHAAVHAEAACKENEEFMWRPRRPPDRRVHRHAASSSHRAATASPSPCSSSPTCSASPKRTTALPRELSGCPSRRTAGDGRGCVGDDPLSFLLEPVRRVHRGPAPRAAQRRAHPARPRPRTPTGPPPTSTSVVRTATFLFAAGQDTTARLLAAALKHLAEHPELQDELRADRERIPNFVEEVLRDREPGARPTSASPAHDHASPASTSRPGRRSMLLNGAANRDPRPLRVPRTSSASTARTRSEHLAFGRGIHSCPGGPLLARRGPRQHRAHPRPHPRHPPRPRSTTARPATRRSSYEPTWILRGLNELHLEFDAGGGAP